MNPYHHAISLRIRHPSRDPADFTRILGLSPSHAWKAGEPRATSKGASLPGVNPTTYWTADLTRGESGAQYLASAIGRALDALSGNAALFEDVVATGGRVEFFVGWFFDRMSGEVFSHELLARLAALKIDLSLDVYPEPD